MFCVSAKYVKEFYSFLHKFESESYFNANHIQLSTKYLCSIMASLTYISLYFGKYSLVNIKTVINPLANR